MNTLMNIRKTVIVPSMIILLISLFTPVLLKAQAFSSNGVVKIVVEGTSNIHDWTLTSNTGNCTGSFVMDASGNITGLNNLGFTMAVNTLKSTHGSTMDNNAYKAMVADTYPNIKFNSPSSTVKSNGNGNYTITSPGKLTISSGTRDVTLIAACKVNADKSVSVNGSYKLVTTDYNVKAISIMLGAIKTKAEVTINYNLTMKPQ
jgi:hypothetical protein